MPLSPRPERRGDADLVYYDGAWSEEERSRVQAAVQTFEARVAYHYPDADGESPWIAVCEPVDGQGAAYFATRRNREGVLRAGSPEALAEKIREVGARPFSETPTDTGTL